MPYKDTKKNSQVSYESQKRLYYPTINVRMKRADENSWLALEEAVKAQDTNKAAYAHAAIKEKLIRDGYLQPQDTE